MSCANPPQTPAAEDVWGNFYYACPDRFIPDTMLLWWELYSLREFDAPIPLLRRNNKYVEAILFYSRAAEEAREAKREHGDDKDGLLELRKAWARTKTSKSE